jgi:hypothetical protein
LHVRANANDSLRASTVKLQEFHQWLCEIWNVFLDVQASQLGPTWGLNWARW